MRKTKQKGWIILNFALLLFVFKYHHCSEGVKQVVNRLKIPQGLSTLLFRRWSEVPSRGRVRGDST